MPALLLLALPFLEIATFVLVGSKIGVLATLGLVLASVVLGLVLLRTQGLASLRRAQAELQAGRSPAAHLVGGAMTVVSAVLLLIPGFLTDIIGLALLLPPVRQFAWRRLKGRIATSRSFVFQSGFGGSGPQRGGDRNGPTIDLDEQDYSRGANPTSPWRLDRPN